MENSYCRYWLQEGILFVFTKPIVFLDLAIARLIVADRIRVQGDDSFLIFCDSRGVRDSSKDARDFLALDGSLLVEAVAIYDDRRVMGTVSSYYLMRSRPLVPTEFFNDRQEGIDFLRKGSWRQ